MPKDGSASYIMKHYSSGDLRDADLERMQILKEVAYENPESTLRVADAQARSGQAMRLADIRGVELGSIIQSPQIGAETRASLIQLYKNKIDSFLKAFQKKYPKARISNQPDSAIPDVNTVHIVLSDEATRSIIQFGLKPQNLILGRDLSVTLVDPW